MTDEITNDSLGLYRCVGCECVTILSVGHPQGKCQCGREFYPVSRRIIEGDPMTLAQVCGEALGPIAMGDELEGLRTPAALASAPGQWTVEGTHSNSSAKYKDVVSIVEEIIRHSAHDLIAGRADAVAGLIVSNLAFKHGIGPMKADD